MALTYTVLLLVALLSFTQCYVPVYVMLPLSAITSNNQVNNPTVLAQQLAKLKQGSVDGVMTDVWWGIVEQQPNQYDWSAYSTLFKLVSDAGLKIKTIMSFHACGGNVGDECNIPLPKWIIQQGNSDIFYTDREGTRNREYLTSGIDNIPLFPNNRTAVDLYSDFMRSFAKNFSQHFGNLITEIQIGLGPAGELRYPSYPLDRWSFPGVGEFQCYDKFLLDELKQAAQKVGHSEWGISGPSNAGTYKNSPSQTGFFSSNGYDNFKSSYGAFFTGWYTDRLIQHGDAILSKASAIFKSYNGLDIAAKISGIHWLYNDASHAAELTAGYNNVGGQGYTSIAKLFAKYNVMMDFTCLEMKNSEQPASCMCSPEELVKQVLTASKNAGIGFEGENALARYDNGAYQQIEKVSNSVMRIKGFEYLRLGNDLISNNNWNTFVSFVQQMHNI